MKVIPIMQIHKGFMLREVAGCQVVVPFGNGTVIIKGMLQLNSVGAFLWKKLEQETSKEELVEAILQHYSVEKETAVKDCEAFLQTLRENQLLVEN